MSRFIKSIVSNVLSFIPDKQYLQWRYFASFKHFPDLNNPRTYNEKIQWMKLYDHDQYYQKLVDKQEVKVIVGNAGIDGLKVIPTLAIWDKAEDININSLPDAFVIKCTHDSGSVKIYHDKSEFDYKDAVKHFAAAMKRSQYMAGREWAYKDIQPRIIAEPFICGSSEPPHTTTTTTAQSIPPKDYKFFCFDGEVKAMFIATDRGIEGTDVKFDFFDRDYNHLPLKHGHENADAIPLKPNNYEKMIDISEKLSKGLRHVRVDLYTVNNDIYFGEFTFYHHCGFVPFDPKQWDYTFGDWFRI